MARGSMPGRGDRTPRTVGVGRWDRVAVRGRRSARTGAQLVVDCISGSSCTWAQSNDHGGGNSFGEFCFTLTVTDIATGCTVKRSVVNRKAALTRALNGLRPGHRDLAPVRGSARRTSLP